MLIGVGATLLLTFISLVVLVQGPDKRSNISLAVTIIAINGWILSVYGLQSVLGESIEYARFIFAIGLAGIICLMWFVDALLYEANIDYARQYLVRPVAALASIVGLVTLSSDLAIRNIIPNSGSLPIPEYGQLFGFYVFSILVTVILITLMLRAGINRSRGHIRSRFIVVALTIISAIFAALLTNLILPAILKDSQTALLSPLAAMILSLGLVYAIVKHGLFDIRFAAVRTLAYAFSLITMAGIYFGLAYIVSVTVFKGASTTSVSLSPVNIILALILAFIFQPIKQFFDRATDKIFFRDRYDSDEFIGRLGEVLTSTTKLNTLLKEAADEICETFKSTHASFVVFRGAKGQTVVGSGRFPRLTAHEYSKLRSNLTNNYGPLILISDEVASDPLLAKQFIQASRLLGHHHVRLVLVLADIGYLLLGEQKGGGYTKRDVRILETISDELVIAVQNARSVQEVEDLNKNLQARIDQATKDLRASNEKLKRLDATKDEFISMASHQLRTPLTSVKGYLSMVLEGDAGKLNDQQRHLLSEAYTSSERMVHLVGDFLNVSRVQTGKFVVDAKPTNLASVIADEVSAIERMAEAHGVSLIYHPPKKFPLLNVDEDKLRQVVMNFVDNAIYYSRENSAIVIKVHATHDEAVVEVHDHGIGVPKAAQDRLFTKFFRADNARRQRPDGTGVGLFLAKKVVTAHGGEIIFQSTEGRGSVFGFRLPISKLKVKQ